MSASVHKHACSFLNSFVDVLSPTRQVVQPNSHFYIDLKLPQLHHKEVSLDVVYPDVWTLWHNASTVVAGCHAT